MSTTTKTFGFNKPELTDAADITAMNQNWDKADDEIAKAKGTNPNLLDNWYFADPINQRAQSSYSGSGYGIDRWTMIEADGSVKLESDGITVYRQLRQYIENPNDVFGKQITASVLTSDGTLHTGTMTPANSDGGQLIVDDTTIHLYMYIVKSAASGNVSFIIECRESVTIQAVKLEFGSQQTLARQDETGKWVLNSMPPNKTLETIKCGSSTDDVNDPYANSKMLYKNLGAAPAGFGLGVDSLKTEYIDTLAKLDALSVNRWFIFTGGSSNPIVMDGVRIEYGGGRVDTYNGNNVRMTLFSYNPSNHSQKYEIVRYNNQGTWGAWEWVNPPMNLGVEYRTTERWQGKPVYVKVTNIGSLPASGYVGLNVLEYVSGLDTIVNIEWHFESSSPHDFYTMPVPDLTISPIHYAATYAWARFTVSSDLSHISCKCVIRYTKS